MGIAEPQTDGRKVWLDISYEPIGTLRLRADHLRNDRTGIHGTLHIGLNDAELEWDTFNIDRREERTRLANAAHKLLPLPVQDIISKEEISSVLGQFCAQVWPVFITAQRPTPLAGLLSDGAAAVYLVKPWIVKGGGSLLFGTPGSGKSYMVMLMAVSADSGVSSIWEVNIITRVLFINLERSALSIAHRLAVVNHILELDPTRKLLTLNARGKSLADVYDIALRSVETEGVELVVLDSISRAGFGSMTEDRPTNQAMDALNSLAPSWVAVGHSPRGDNEHIFGSVMFDAAADVVVQQVAEKKDAQLGISLRMTKANDIPIAPPALIGFEFNGTGLSRVWHAREQEFIELSLNAPESSEAKVARFLGANGASTQAEVETGTGINQGNLSKLLTTSHLFVRLSERRGQSWLWGLGQRD